jgi:hypothetical protein
MTQVSDVLALTLARVQRVEPALARGVSRWFDRNADFVEPIADGILTQFKRSGQALTERSPDAVVSKLLTTFRAVPEIHAKAERFRDLLRVIVESCIQALVESPPSIEAVTAAASALPAPSRQRGGHQDRRAWAAA